MNPSQQAHELAEHVRNGNYEYVVEQLRGLDKREVVAFYLAQYLDEYQLGVIGRKLSDD